MQRVDRWLIEWAEQCIFEALWRSELSGINVVEKLLRDPGVTTGTSGHKVLWWPKNHRISKISKAMHQIDPVSRVILIINYGFLPKEDGNKYTLSDLRRDSSLAMGEISAKKRKSRNKIKGLLDTKNN